VNASAFERKGDGEKAASPKRGVSSRKNIPESKNDPRLPYTATRERTSSSIVRRKNPIKNHGGEDPKKLKTIVVWDMCLIYWYVGGSPVSNASAKKS